MTVLSSSLKWNVSVIVTICVLAASAVGAFMILRDDVGEMEPKVERNAEDIEAVEKDIIGVKASVEALGVQQEYYHKESDRKLDAILRAVE